MDKPWVRVLLAVMLFAFASLADSTESATRACGTERWDVKTLSDPASSGVNLAPTTVTVEQLRSMQAPDPIALHTPRYALEKQTVALNAAIKGAKLEADSDFRVVIAGATGVTMIAEFPNATCVANSAFRQRIGDARQAFVQKYSTPPSTRFATLQ